MGGLGTLGAFFLQVAIIRPVLPAQPAQKSVLAALRRPVVPSNNCSAPCSSTSRSGRCSNIYWLYVGNGGRRSPIEARVFKSLGVRPGIPELIVIHQGQIYRQELMADTGKIAPVRAAAHARMRAAGAEVEVATGINDALDLLQRWQLLRGRTQ